MARIAIGIPCFNEEAFIAGSIISALRQAEQTPDIEIIVSDNKSTDQTVEKIEAVLEAMPKNAPKVRLFKQQDNMGVERNFCHVFDHSDSELFLWLGDHDQISAGYVSTGLDQLKANSTTSMYCGGHKTLALSGAVIEQPIIYDFNQENPIERYLKSIVEINNCYIFHSIFRRQVFNGYKRKPTPSPDHILISRSLWAGKLWQSPDCHYMRRYFPIENRLANSRLDHRYVHASNNINFYDAYLSDLESLASRLPAPIKSSILQRASDLLINRFGLPFITDSVNGDSAIKK